MKILEIHPHPDKTNSTKVSYRTDPPLTEEVFNKFAMMVRPNNLFTHEDGLLVTHRPDLNQNFLDEMEGFLTQAEQLVEKDKNTTAETHQTLLKRLSEESGRRIGQEPPVS